MIIFLSLNTCDRYATIYGKKRPPSPSNFSAPLSNDEKIALAHMIKNITKEEIQAHKVALQQPSKTTFVLAESQKQTTIFGKIAKSSSKK